MRRTAILLLCLFWIAVPPTLSQADDSTPVAQPTVPAASEPAATAPAAIGTSPPVVDQAPTPDSRPGPVQITKESHPSQRITSPRVTEPAAAPLATPPVVSEPNYTRPPETGPLPIQANPPAGVQPASPGDGVTLSPGNGALGYISSPPVSAAAPSQLVCQGKTAPVSRPFLSAPYAGWTEINSFMDHDSPDYTVDGLITIANGLSARSSAGTQSDFFPAYWSGALRQYINYDGHNGYDFGISYQPVLAAADGTVSFAGWNSDDPYAGYGQMVLIDHRNGYVTLYGHLSKLAVGKGDKVVAGQEIGISGSTGNSTGPHLHFSVFHNCQVSDPYGWTGAGRDPLYELNGEQSRYLWLPGRDPLVLNPPPNWPSFPAGLEADWSRISVQLARSRRLLPPVDHLLLLELPSNLIGGPGPGVVLARAHQVILRESEDLAPFLNALRNEGMVQAYSVLPSAAAVWVRGSASAQQLEGLPGVASLSGTQTKDVWSAQAGLAHALLLQTSGLRAPALWPAGFRSAMITARVIVNLAIGDSQVMGISTPGTRVELNLLRRHAIVASAQAISDPETGGFVASLQDVDGRDVVLDIGDVVRASAGTASTAVPVLGLDATAGATAAGGRAPAGSSVRVDIVPAGGRLDSKETLADSRTGAFTVRAPSTLPPGTLLVNTLQDSAGDTESITGYVPGLAVLLGSSTIHGWTPRANVSMSIRRSGHLLLRRTIRPEQDGSFTVQLGSHAVPIIPHIGDTVEWRAGHQSRTFVLNPASVSVLRGRPFVDAANGYSLGLGLAPLSLRLDESTGAATGRTLPGTAVRMQIADRSGRVLCSGVASSATSGKFATTLLDAFGLPVRIKSGERLTVWSGPAIRTWILPVLSDRHLAKRSDSVWLRVSSALTIGDTVRVPKAARHAPISKERRHG